MRWGHLAPSTAVPDAAPLTSIGNGLHGPAGLAGDDLSRRGLTHAAALAFDPVGRLWVATAAFTVHRYRRRVRRRPRRRGTHPRSSAGSGTPLGLLWYSGSLYVASTSQVDAYSDFNGTRFLAHRTILTLPTGSGEVNELVLAPDGRMLMGITASCDHCTPSLAISGSIVSFLPNGTGSPGVRHAASAPRLASSSTPEPMTCS